MLVYIAGLIETSTGDIPWSWQVTLGVSAVVFFLVTMYHTFILPRSADDRPRVSADTEGNGTSGLAEFANSFVSFVKKPGFLLAVAFMLLYRLPEGFLIKLCQPFLVHSTAEGGLGLTTELVGLVYGTFGVIALLAGGIVGGVFASKVGLKKALWPMAACMTLPCLTFVYLAIAQRGSLHRAVWLRLRFHGLYALYDVLLGRRVQDIALCHLHGVHGVEHDVARFRGRLYSGGNRLCQLLLDGDGMLHRDSDSHLSC